MERFFSFSGGSLPLGRRTYIMGILNVTPDSFYDGGRYFDPAAAVKKAVSLAEEGADIIDIGALSTRPNAERASEAEELRRLRAVLPQIRRETPLPLSVDTYRPAVARYCLDEGADIVNDVSGVFNEDMAALIKAYAAGWVVMHAGPRDAKTETETEYPGGVVRDVQAFFYGMIEKCAAFGVPEEKLCLDPGFGFAKNNRQNTALLQGLRTLDTRGCALLAGLSRKRFVRAAAMSETEPDVLNATLAADLICASAGADILRVHDVAAHKALTAPFDRFAVTR
ncbi:MAG: dihydropteroate synthase [Clostridia bacterium]|nr:dihydropteroate synthase [Clostridia bacterium]